MKVGERFWIRVERPSEPDGCWLWRGPLRDSKGYGQYKAGASRWLAHRMAWMLTNGPIPDGMRVLHRCDNPPCVRPDHLFLGTQLDNIRDRDTKGRQRAPIKHNAAVIQELRRRRAAGESIRAISLALGIDNGYVSRLARNIGRQDVA